MIRMPGSSYHGTLPTSDESLKSLGEDLRSEIQHLAVDIGERNVWHCPRQLAEAADYIEEQFKAAGYKVNRQKYTVNGVNCDNIEVEKTGTIRPEEIVVVGAHYDTAIGTPGANDNTSGVAALLALARKFALQKSGRTIRFVAFVNEEHHPIFKHRRWVRGSTPSNVGNKTTILWRC